MYPVALLSGGLVARFGKDVELGMSFRQVVDERWMLERAQETGFTFTLECTHVVYTKGFFEKLGSVVSEEDVLAGLVSFKFIIKLK